MPVIIDDSRVQEALQRLQSKRGLHVGLLEGAEHLQSVLNNYPPASHRPQAGLWTAKQRRAFFALLKAGRIDVPYRRGLSPQSERLAQKFQIRAESGGDTVNLINMASYYNLVQGPKQTAYHRTTGWKTDREVGEAEDKRVVDIVGRRMMADLP